MLRALLDRMIPPGPAEAYRREARARLREKGIRHPGRDVVELGGLTLFERELATRPRRELVGSARSERVEGTSLAQSASYTSHLAATLGVSGPLAPAVTAVLDDFHSDRLWKSNGCARLLGGLAPLDESQKVVASHFLRIGGRSIEVTGVSQPAELENLEKALSKLWQRLPQALELLDTIHLRTYLGYVPGTSSSINGIAGSKSGQLAIENLVARSEKGAEGTLFHELGHLLDRHLGTAFRARSTESDTPFASQDETVSRYARTSPGEDLAETHRELLQCYERVRECPDLVHASGAVGAKMAFILEAYGQTLPPASARLQAILDESQSPFGWQTPAGTVGARQDLERSALELLRNGFPEDEQQEWLERRLAGESPGPSAARSVEGLLEILRQAAQARQQMRQGDRRGQRALLEGLQRSLKRQLEAGGPPLRKALEAHVEQHEERHSGARQQLAIVSRRLD